MIINLIREIRKYTYIFVNLLLARVFEATEALERDLRQLSIALYLKNHSNIFLKVIVLYFLK